MTVRGYHEARESVKDRTGFSRLRSDAESTFGFCLGFGERVAIPYWPSTVNDYGTLAAANIALEMKDLLPGSENEFSVSDGNSQRRSEQCSLQVGMAVSVVLGLFVAIVAAGWNQPVQNGRNVGPQPGFELNGANGGSASHVEYVDKSDFHAGFSNCGRHSLRKIVHVSVTLVVTEISC